MAHPRELGWLHRSVFVTDKPSAKISVSDVDKLEQLLDQTPAHRDTIISKRRAIARLAPKLYAMRDKGYSWNAIAGWLTEHGLSVTAAVLNGYLREPPSDEGPHSRRRSKGRARKRAAATAGASPASSSSRSPELHAPAQHEASASKVASADVARERVETRSRRSAFAVRPDSEEI